ncbi:MAG: fructosamine kinase family protein, partial [Cyanobacteria bacterium MAG COS3_bin_20]|nr:fructosamine kinase family protein [Cyanobacteria bacterium MAG COS3_bin_20]
LSGYREVIPEASDADGRVEIYNLYHLLNHANLFGGSYLSQCRASLKDLARRL